MPGRKVESTVGAVDEVLSFSVPEMRWESVVPSEVHVQIRLSVRLCSLLKTNAVLVILLLICRMSRFPKDLAHGGFSIRSCWSESKQAAQ